MTLGMDGVLQGLSLGLSKGLTCPSCGSYAPQPLRDLLLRRTLGIPSELFVWVGVAAAHDGAVDADHVRPPGVRGRRQPAGGAYLSGVGVRGVTVALYTLSGVFAALAGIALVAYGGQPSLGLGDPYLFESIAAVVVGGVSILGGRGHYVGVVAGSLTLVAVVSLLLAESMPDWGRDVFYGCAILAILLLYGREKRDV